MANVTAADVKRLREATGAGMLDCKKALEEADGDFEAAIDELRKKGAKNVGKRAGRTAGNGLVTIALDGTSAGVMVELNCETDFVAKTDQFQQAAADIVATALRERAADRLVLLGLEVRPGVTVQQVIDEAGVTLQEKIELGRYAILEGGYVSSYLHRADRSLPPVVGVLVRLDGENEAAAKNVAQQAAAMQPQYLTRDEVPAEVVAKERSLAEQMAREEGKPEQALPKIVDGRVGSFFKDVVLTEQPYVKENKKTVGQMLKEQGVSVTAFARFKVGQAS